MTVRTIPLQDLTVIIRKPFERLEKDNVPLSDPKTGQPIYMAEAACGGLLRNTFTPLTDQPTGVRIKILGRECTFPANTPVKLRGAKLTTWYQGRGQGRGARSDVTITVEDVQTSTEAPAMRGGLPAHIGGVDMMLLGQTFRTVDNTQAPDKIDVMFDAAEVFQVEGVAEMFCGQRIPEISYYKKVRPIDLRAYFVVPDSGDVSQRTKSELIMACAAVEEVAAEHNGNGRKPRPEPTVEAEQPVG